MNTQNKKFIFPAMTSGEFITDRKNLKVTVQTANSKGDLLLTLKKIHNSQEIARQVLAVEFAQDVRAIRNAALDMIGGN